MEVRERRSPRDQSAMLSTIESDLLMEVKDMEEVPGPPDYIPPLSSSSVRPKMLREQSMFRESKMLKGENWLYPVKPAFANNDFDSEDDSDEEDDEDMAMMTTCCCCFSTKNGSIIVGIISLIVAFVISVASCFALINVDDFSEEIRKSYVRYESAVKLNSTVNRLAVIDGLVDVNTVIDNLRTIFIAFLVFYAIYTFSSLFLTYGACSDLRSLLLPWIVLEFIPFSIQLAGIVLVFVYGKEDPTLSHGGLYIIVGLSQIVAFVIHVYWWMCPVAHYQNLKEVNEVTPLIHPSHPMYPSIQKY